MLSCCISLYGMILTSCSQRVEHNWFQYYDLFTLEGKAPLTQTGFGYPYVAIKVMYQNSW
jgi:hypothetical protein